MEKDVRWIWQFGARLLRVLLLAGMSSATNQIPVRASALTYTSILAFIPFVVILSSVAGQFGYLDLLSRLVISFNDSLNLDLNLDPILGVIEYAQKVDFHRLGLVGSLALLFTFFLSMSNIELAFDHIWDIRKKRNWWRRIVEYTPFLLLTIGLILMAGNFLLKYRSFLVEDTGSTFRYVLHETFFVLGTLGMVAFTWAALWLLFFLLPNTKVRFLPAALGASISTLGVYGLTRVLLLFPTLFVSRNNYIYGSLAALPVLLLIIYLFWVIVLFGAAVAFIYQRLYHGYHRETTEAPATSAAFHEMEEKVLAALRAVHALSGSPEVEGRKGVPLAVLARRLGGPPARAEILAYPLVELDLLAKKRTKEGPIYAPRGPLSQVDLTAIHNLLLRLDSKGTGELRALTALDEIKHTLGVLYSTGKVNPPMYLSAAMDRGEGHKA